MRISEVIRRKGDDVVTIAPDATVADLAALLRSRGIGAVVVTSDGATILGIVSERDVVHRLAYDGAAALAEPVHAIMSADVRVCAPEDDLEELARRMTDLRVRHVPVVVDERLHAIVSIGDVVKNRLDELQSERDDLVTYVNS